MNETIFTSRLTKVVIAVLEDHRNKIEEVAVIFMDKLKVTRISLISSAYDEDDEDLSNKIIDEETDSRFVDKDDTVVVCYNVCNDFDAISDQIVDIITEYAEDDTLPDIDYILYIDGLRGVQYSSTFGEELHDKLYETDYDFTPTTYDDIFGTSRLEKILTNSGIEHTYSQDSALSAAIWFSIAFDAIAQKN